MAGQGERAGQVRGVLGGDEVQGGADLGQGGGIPAGQSEHAVMAGQIAGAGDHAGQVTEGDQEAVVAAQQVLRESQAASPGRGSLRPRRAAGRGSRPAGWPR